MDQIILFGKESLNDIIHQCNIEKCFIVCGTASYTKTGIADYINELSLPIIRFSDFSPNPQYQEICDGLELFMRSKCDAMIAVGGGSAIDVAKCIKLFSSTDPDSPYGEDNAHDFVIPFIAIPTTAGSGSESTRHIVYYKDGIKQSVSKDTVLPDYAILDEEFLHSLPDYQKKSTFFDSLCQAIESYWSNRSDKISRIYAMSAIRIIKRCWKGYFFDNKYYKEMLYASNLAGRAINRSKTTAAHAMSYGLTSRYGIAHGHAVALCMDQIWPRMVEIIELSEPDMNGSKCKKVMSEISEVIDYSEFHAMLDEADLQAPVSDKFNEDINTLAGKVNVERLSNNPVTFNDTEIRTIYENIVVSN